MNWQSAVALTSWFGANLAHKNPQGKWPLGGWESLGESAENAPELRRRIELVLSDAGAASSERGRLLAEFAATLGQHTVVPELPARAPVAGELEIWNPGSEAAEGFTEKRVEDEEQRAAAFLARGPGADALDLPPVLDVASATPVLDVEPEVVDDSDPFEGVLTKK
jgi:hypothetical protein